MRSEDRKPSKRVFPLLQNLDLDSVTFAQVQGTGNPITIEDMNEQEMFDLVLVNLARLCVAGEWSGLLTAGGGDTNLLVPNPQAATFKRYSIMGAPFVTVYRSLSVDTGVNTLRLHPFIAGQSGDIIAVTMKVATAAASGEYRISFWSADSDTGEIEVPTLGTATIDASTTGTKTQDTFSATVTLVKGRLYWFGVNSNNALLRAYGIDNTYGANSIVAHDTDGITSSGITGYDGVATYTSGVPTSIPTLQNINQDFATVWYDFA